MPGRQVPIHYLRPNHTTWTPPAVICFDTETRSELTRAGEVHTLRLWTATYDDRRPPKGRRAEQLADAGTFASDLALTVHRWCSQRKTVWMYAHNLAFDITVSDLPGELVRLGWIVTDFALDGRAPFLRLARGDRHLTIADSWGWLPVKLETVGQAVNVTKPPLPAQDDTDAAWMARCEGDTVILREAMLALMDWWDDRELGRWTVTGSASGWNAMRHIPTPERILIRPEAAEQAADRAAIYGGRRSVWRTGELPPGRYVTLDIERAYTAACAELPLPTERMGQFRELELDSPFLRGDRHGVIADCLIQTAEPIVPARAAGCVWYGTGEFRSVLASPDIAAAAGAGALRAVGAGWLHKLGMPLRPWAQWIIADSSPDAAGVPDLAKIVLRAWGRSAVGKWAQRGYERIELGAAPTTAWNHGEAWDHHAGVRASIVDFAGKRYQVSATADPENAYPGILAFIESYVRQALGRVLAMIGDEAVVMCDTDGLMVDATAADLALRRLMGSPPVRRTGSDRLDTLIQLAAGEALPFRLREKQSYKRVTVLGPQHMELDGRRRASGMPASAEPGADGQLQALLWPKLTWQMSHGRAGAYVRPQHTYRLAATYAPGWVLADGSVQPVELRIAADGTNDITPWPETVLAQSGAVLASSQNKRLERYRAEA